MKIVKTIEINIISDKGNDYQKKHTFNGLNSFFRLILQIALKMMQMLSTNLS